MDRNHTSTLSDMCELIVDCPHFTPEWTDSGYIVIRNQNIRDGKLDLSEKSYTHREDFERRIKRAKPRTGDIIFTREAPMGEVCMIPKHLECCVGQRQVLLRPKREVNGRYLFFALRSSYVRHQIFWNEGTGSTVSNVRIPVLKELRIPRLRDEKAIGDLLGALDDKIDLNRRMNETLEAMAQAIFKDWFVDFGPVRAKAEGRPPYLAPELWALFPDALDDDDEPVGWEMRSIYAFANVVYGAPFASKQFNTEQVGLPLIRIRDLATHEPEICTEEKHPKGHIIDQGDIVVGMDGEFRLYVWKGPQSWLNQRVCHFEPLAGVPVSFLVEALQEPLAYFERGKVGTTVIHLGKSDIDTFQLIYPGEQLLFAYGAIAEPLVNKCVKNALEGRALAQLRDLLLPKLMSGEIRLRDAEKMVEAVA